MATRTTLALDDDILNYARERARHERRSIGEIVSDTMRAGMARKPKLKYRNGIALLPINEPGRVMTMDLVNELRDFEDW